ncbi:hypothetical protein XFF6992_360080 [Xanthomonas citri pv. fuscans]|nr:hypothetical protein XFF6992_360080 [Xanthomonas citri pv. fuscans]SOO33605.1 hypothetical protein XFF6994_3010027 [Xanthomonas citri pv. fuscans]
MRKVGSSHGRDGRRFTSWRRGWWRSCRSPDDVFTVMRQRWGGRAAQPGVAGARGADLPLRLLRPSLLHQLHWDVGFRRRRLGQLSSVCSRAGD